PRGRRLRATSRPTQGNGAFITRPVASSTARPNLNGATRPRTRRGVTGAERPSGEGRIEEAYPIGDVDLLPRTPLSSVHVATLPWLRIERLIRAILEVRRDKITRPVMKATLRDAVREREKIRRAGW